MIFISKIKSRKDEISNFRHLKDETPLRFQKPHQKSSTNITNYNNKIY